MAPIMLKLCALVSSVTWSSPRGQELLPVSAHSVASCVFVKGWNAITYF